MFGIEASVMLPLVHGIPVVDRCPLLPADAAAAFDACFDNAIWITTPLHLRSLQRAGETLRNCGAVLASTMPLAARLAAEIEALTEAAVLEIYGSTETGAIAMRRTAREAHWRPLPGIHLEPADNGTRVSGLHFASPQTLADRVAVNESGAFTLVGREADLIKIGGRRASLAGLNQLLNEMPGLADGVFYLPSTDAPTERLVLIYEGETLDRQESEAWLRARLDPIFLPRAYIRVDRLPRAGAGKLPRAALDAIYSEWRGSLKAVRRLEFNLRIPPDHPALPGHFPGNPIVPGVLLLDTVIANLERATGSRAVRLQQVKFLAVLRPDEPALAECEIDGHTASFRVSTRWGTATAPLASGTVLLELEGTACPS
jgi:acyl-coenzyme A synthetase/AMP-(fatty) acid ligase